MKIGYQGIPGSYSEQAILEYLGDKYTTVPLKDFDIIFEEFNKNTFDVALIPLENNSGHSLDINYDLLIKYDLSIVGEYLLPINHCLISSDQYNIEDIVFVTSHPQALIQSSEFIDQHKFTSFDSFDTAGAVKFIKENKSKNAAAIASKHSAKIYGMKILQENIQNNDISYTRFILISKNETKIPELNKFIENRVTLAFCLKDNPGALSNVLNYFSQNNINISKIQSQPKDNQYLFYLDIESNLQNKNCQDAIEKLKSSSSYFKLLGNYASLSPTDKPLRKMCIGILGFGRFGQFLATRINKLHTIIATSRKDYSEQANNLGIDFYYDMNEFFKLSDIIIISVSISSFYEVMQSIPKEYLKDKLIVDVLSVKELPKNVLNSLNSNHEFDILCTHPMFGPESGDKSWEDLYFVYEKVRITNQERCQIFLNIFKEEGCKMVEMNCQKHDNIGADSQFITHLIGRLLKKLDIKELEINTTGYQALIDIMNSTCKDSDELFEGLYQQNRKSAYTLDNLKSSLDSIINDLNPSFKHKYNFRKSMKLINETNYSLDNLDSNNNIINAKNCKSEFIGNNNVKSKIKMINDSDSLNISNIKGRKNTIESIIKYLKSKKKLEYNQNEIMCTNGDHQAIFQILFYLCNEGDEVILPIPARPIYLNIINLIGAKPIFLETTIENNYQIESKKLQKLVSNKTKAIILCNPHNPTGAIQNYESLLGLSKIVQNSELFVIDDQIFELLDFYSTHTSFASFDNMKKFTFTLNSLSIGFGLSGLRFGFIAGPEKHINKITLIQDNITSSVNEISQSIAVDVLNNYLDYNMHIKEIETVSNFIYNQIIQIPGFKCNYPEAGLSIFPDVSFYFNKKINDIIIRNANDICQLLLDHNLKVRSGEDFNSPRNIRITYTADLERVKEIIKILNKVFQTNQIQDSALF